MRRAALGPTHALQKRSRRRNGRAADGIKPLRRLIKEGHIVARIGEEDRRLKHLFATAKGGRLYHRVLAQQVEKFTEAFRRAGPDAARGFLRVHRHLVQASELEWIGKALRAVETDQRAK